MEEVVKPSRMHCKKEGHDNEHCWRLHPKLKPKRFDGKDKQKTVATVQQDLGSDSSDDTLIIIVGIQGTISLHANENSESHASTSSSNESLVSE